MVKGVIPTAREKEPKREIDLSCTFCGPGTWAMWDVVTDDGVSFTCDWHHAELGRAKIIRLERIRGKEVWEEIHGFRETFYQEGNQDNFIDSQDIDDYE
jgi:hypothetical protein